ncbi:MAG: TetR family transcriptional regulator [Propionibacteriales bacterium]|nr:TetR family transcriptional regulator [Propionibacteriales bacterium]
MTPAGERLLDAASELFYTRGIRAVGVDTIAEVAGTTKKTLYDRFGSKDRLVALYLERRAERWQVYVLAYLAEHAPTPGTKRVLAVLDALDVWQGQHMEGCAFVNAYAEIGKSDHPGVAVIRADKQWIRDLYQQLVREAGLPSPGRKAAQLALVHEGALVLATAGGQSDAMRQARSAAATLLAA